jgi:EF hand
MSSGYANNFSSRIGLLIVAVSALGVASCSSRPSAIRPPSISATGVADEAISSNDADGDGTLSGAELDKVPALKAAIQTLDSNQDGKVSYDEIVDRIKMWQATQIGVMLVKVEVKMDGQPLADADVQFEPEAFMGDDLLAGGGTTDQFGVTYPRIPKENRPDPNMPGGLQLGFYKIRVSKKVNGKETVPEKYNTATTLGHQIAIDDAELAKSQKISLNLTKK